MYVFPIVHKYTISFIKKNVQVLLGDTRDLLQITYDRKSDFKLQGKLVHIGVCFVVVYPFLLKSKTDAL